MAGARHILGPSTQYCPFPLLNLFNPAHLTLVDPLLPQIHELRDLKELMELKEVKEKVRIDAEALHQAAEKADTRSAAGLRI